MRHGARRAAEIEEVAKTLADLGLPDDMARATAGWQRRMSETCLPLPGDPEADGVKALAVRLLSRLRR
jgi:hypothetical protein